MKIYSEITTILNYGPKTSRVGKFKTFNEKKNFFYPIIVGNYWGANCVNTEWVWHIFPLRFLLVETTSASVEECKTASNSGSVSRGRNRKAFKRQDTPRVEADIEKFCASATSRHRHPILHSKSVNAPFVSAGTYYCAQQPL